LRANDDDVVEMLADAYDDAPEDALQWRWALVQTLAALETNLALDALEEIAFSPAPSANPPTSQHLTLTGSDQELLIRGRAAEGIARLAKAGNSTADALLLDCAENCSILAQMYSITGYLATGNRAARVVQVKAVLPVHLHYLTLPIEDDIPEVDSPTGVPSSEIPPLEEPD
jgi:hypothetical protein